MPVQPKHIRSHAFRGKRFRICWRKPAQVPEDKGRRVVLAWTTVGPKTHNITIDPNLSERDLLRALIDEGTHANFFDLDNDSVDEASRSLAHLLWRVGFRLKRMEEE